MLTGHVVLKRATVVMPGAVRDFADPAQNSPPHRGVRDVFCGSPPESAGPVRSAVRLVVWR